MTERTAAEALVDYKKVMGEDLGLTFHHLLQETWHLGSVWDQHETLFENRERIALLNASGGSFFGNVQNIFFNHVILGICRLTDPPKTGRKENLTIQRLPLLVRDTCKRNVEKGVTRAISASQFGRDWRNRLIAHSDLGRYTQVSQPLEKATRLGVTAAIVAIHDVLRIVSLEYRDSDLALIEIGDDAAFNVLHQLRRGRDAKEEQRKRYLVGDIRDSDFHFPEWLKKTDVNGRYRSSGSEED